MCCTEGSGYFEPYWAISKQQFFNLDIKDFIPIHKLCLVEILKLPLGSIVYAKNIHAPVSNDILVIKGCHRFFYYRDCEPSTCYADFDGLWGGEHNYKEYDYYLALRKIKGIIK